MRRRTASSRRCDSRRKTPLRGLENNSGCTGSTRKASVICIAVVLATSTRSRTHPASVHISAGLRLPVSIFGRGAMCSRYDCHCKTIGSTSEGIVILLVAHARADRPADHVSLIAYSRWKEQKFSRQPADGESREALGDNALPRFPGLRLHRSRLTPPEAR